MRFGLTDIIKLFQCVLNKIYLYNPSLLQHLIDIEATHEKINQKI